MYLVGGGIEVDLPVAYQQLIAQIFLTAAGLALAGAFQRVGDTVELDSVPYALECASQRQASGSEENLRNQLLVRYRQVYLDSATNQIHAGKQMI